MSNLEIKQFKILKFCIACFISIFSLTVIVTFLFAITMLFNLTNISFLEAIEVICLLNIVYSFSVFIAYSFVKEYIHCSNKELK